MTTHRTYSCNVCKEPITDRTRGIGLYFSSTDESGHAVKEVRFHERPLHDAETHICQACLQGFTLLIQQKRGLHVIA
ncbi:MAG: hypothetical protein AAB433_02605 [Nitrospirota bacterium]